MSHGLQVGASYTYSHATDEQSAMGLFYNGNNPLNLRSGYGLSDFDRKHVLNFTYRYELPKFFSASSFKGRIADGWAISGLTVIQSGQPYSVVDYSGAVGSIFYGVNDGITNPVVPLVSCTPKQAVTGASGAHAVPGEPNTFALNPSCFGIPLLSPSALNGAIPSNDPYETNFIDHGQRNIFRQSWQRRADISLSKITQVTERSSLKFTFDVFNVTNTASFDIPIDDISQNIGFDGFPVAGVAPTLSPCNSSFTQTPPSPPGSLYVCQNLSGLGITNKTIGSPRADPDVVEPELLGGTGNWKPLRHLHHHKNHATVNAPLALPNIFVPHSRIGANILAQQRDALFGVEIDNLYSERAEPVDPTLEVPALADDHRAKAKLPDKPAAIPAGREGSDHDQVAVAASPSRTAEGVGFAMQRRIAVLYSAVASGTDNSAVCVENRGADWNAALRQPYAGFRHRHRQHRSVIQVRHCARLYGEGE